MTLLKMPTILSDNKSVLLKSKYNIQGGLHYVLFNKLKANIHNRDLGMFGTIDYNSPPCLKRIFNAHGVRSYYESNNTTKIRTYFTDTVLSYRMLTNIEKMEKKEGIWLVPDYNIDFYPIFVLNEDELKEFIIGYNTMSELFDNKKFEETEQFMRKVKFVEDGLILLYF